MEYQILAESSIKSMEKSVIVHIALGWLPLGGVSYGQGNYLQSMTRTKKDKK